MPSYGAAPSVPPILPTSRSPFASILDHEGTSLKRVLLSCVRTVTGVSRRAVDTEVVAVSLMSITASAEDVEVRAIDGASAIEKQALGVEKGRELYIMGNPKSGLVACGGGAA